MRKVERWNGERMVQSGPPELFKLLRSRTGSTASKQIKLKTIVNDDVMQAAVCKAVQHTA